MRDRLSWRKFIGLGVQDAVPDETTLVRFRQRIQEHKLHEQLLGLINEQLEKKGLILKTCTLVDATLLQAARRPSSDKKAGGKDPDASYTVRGGEPHYGYKAHVAVDEEHTLIRNVSLTGANVHDSEEFENVVKGDEGMVIADRAYWSKKVEEWCERNGVVNGVIQRAVRGKELSPLIVGLNRGLNRVRNKIEQVFGWWKRSVGYWRVRYKGREPNRLELEFKSVCWNLKKAVMFVAVLGGMS